MHGTAHASNRAAPCPAPLRPAINVDVGAPSVAPSAHANRAGASRKVDVFDDGTHAAGGAQPLDGLQPILVAVLSPQVVQVPVIVRTMTHRVAMKFRTSVRPRSYPWPLGGST